jgi:mRNA-degrading endonuclease toxin of MazEF toxin-antitoxin module
LESPCASGGGGATLEVVKWGGHFYDCASYTRDIIACTEKDISEILEQDHDWWSQIKQRISLRDADVLFKQGEIWWWSLGLNLGKEIYGKSMKFTRPVLVFRKFTHDSFMGLPLTTQEKVGTWYVETSLQGVKRWAMLNQARSLDSKRLTKRIGELDDKQFAEVKRRFIEFYSS